MRELDFRSALEKDDVQEGGPERPHVEAGGLLGRDGEEVLLLPPGLHGGSTGRDVAHRRGHARGDGTSERSDRLHDCYNVVDK